MLLSIFIVYIDNSLGNRGTWELHGEMDKPYLTFMVLNCDKDGYTTFCSVLEHKIRIQSLYVKV